MFGRKQGLEKYRRWSDVQAITIAELKIENRKFKK